MESEEKGRTEEGCSGENRWQKRKDIKGEEEEGRGKRKDRYEGEDESRMMSGEERRSSGGNTRVGKLREEHGEREMKMKGQEGSNRGVLGINHTDLSVSHPAAAETKPPQQHNICCVWLRGSFHRSPSPPLLSSSAKLSDKPSHKHFYPSLTHTQSLRGGRGGGRWGELWDARINKLYVLCVCERQRVITCFSKHNNVWLRCVVIIHRSRADSPVIWCSSGGADYLPTVLNSISNSYSFWTHEAA